TSLDQRKWARTKFRGALTTRPVPQPAQATSSPLPPRSAEASSSGRSSPNQPSWVGWVRRAAPTATDHVSVGPWVGVNTPQPGGGAPPAHDAPTPSPRSHADGDAQPRTGHVSDPPRPAGDADAASGPPPPPWPSRGATRDPPPAS